MDIQKWAEKLNSDTYDKWCEFPKWRSGFQVFYSAIRKNPPIMILSLNPGGEVDFSSDDICKQYRENNFAVQNYNSYIKENYKMAKAV